MDDGFDWLDDLPTDLKVPIWHLMDYVAEGRHAQVDAIVPGLVARARAEQRPWVEIFARNFALRSQVLHREDVRDGLGQAVDLLDRAHQPDAAGCPQTICTAHAVCAAYGIKDPAGYIDERLKVSTETLSRTDPRRVCWLCISNEHADALIDAGRPDAALTFLAEQRRIRLAAGAAVDPDDFGLRETAAHLLAGRLDGAHRALDNAQTDERGASWLRTWRQWKARLLAADGRIGEAIPLISSVEEIIADGGFRLHFETLPLLYGADAPEADALGDVEIVRQMCVLGRACITRGGGPGVHALLWAAEKLVAHDEPTLADQAIDAARRGLDLLRDPAEAEARTDRLLAQLAKARDGASEAPTFEAEYRALRANPDLERLQSLTAAARAFGMTELARALVVEIRRAAPNDDALFQFAGQCLLDDDPEALEALLASPPATADGPLLAGWMRGLAALRRGDRAAAIEHIVPVAAARPGWGGVADRLGGLYFELQRFDEADAVWSAAAETMPAPNAFHWHCISAATAAGAWDRLRALAKIVEFPVPGESGPFEADYGLVRVRFDDDGRPYYATRTGPVTARVLSLRAPGGPERHRDLVLFHPETLDSPDDDDDAPRLHAVVSTLEDSGCLTVDLDGRHPGEPAAQTLRDALAEGGFFHQVAAGEEYMVVDPESGENHPGIYLLIAALPDELAALEAILSAVDGPGPRVWSTLLDKAGRSEEAAEHRAIAEAWGMV